MVLCLLFLYLSVHVLYNSQYTHKVLNISFSHISNTKPPFLPQHATTFTTIQNTDWNTSVSVRPEKCLPTPPMGNRAPGRAVCLRPSRRRGSLLCASPPPSRAHNKTARVPVERRRRCGFSCNPSPAGRGKGAFWLGNERPQRQKSNGAYAGKCRQPSLSLNISRILSCPAGSALVFRRPNASRIFPARFQYML